MACLLTVATVAAERFHEQYGSLNATNRLRLNDDILTRQTGSPYRYRVLVPVALEAANQSFQAISAKDREASFAAVSRFFELAALIATLCALYWFLCRDLPAPYALIGSLLAGASLHVALRDHYYQPWSLLEPLLLVAILATAEDGRWPWTIGLCALAAVNRETGVLFPPIAAVASLDLSRDGGVRAMVRRNWRVALYGVGAQVAACLAYGIVRSVQGEAGHLVQLGPLFQRNLATSAIAIDNTALLLGVVWIAFFSGLRRVSPFRRKAAWAGLAVVIPPFVIFGLWLEVRLLLPLLPIVLPPAMATLADVLEGRVNRRG